ncbi:hypothetical protein SNE40_004424 [Patella caerulea]|uniref:Uncharacterized protein n=1 Tax=Patella caerulea TaxID=87958 RepID=A0AAN8KBQ9_PATCE
MTIDDKSFYEDNFHGMYIARCTNKIPRSLVKHQKRIEERFLSEQRRKQESEAAELRQTEIYLNELRDSLKESDVEMKEDEELAIQLECLPSFPQKQPSSYSFLKVKVRNSKKYFNESLIRCIVHCHSMFKVTTGDLLGILECFTNTVFDQKWSQQAEHCVDTDDSDDEYEDETLGGKRRRKISGQDGRKWCF